MISFFKRFLGSVVALSVLVSATALQAQQTESRQKTPMQQGPSQQETDVSDEELEQFVAINQAIQTINQTLQQEMIEAVKSEGMDPQRFIQLTQAQQAGQEPETKEGEMKKYQKSQKKVQEIQQKGQQKAEQMIEKEDMTTERYQEVYQAVQQDPALQQKLQEMQK